MKFTLVKYFKFTRAAILMTALVCFLLTDLLYSQSNGTLKGLVIDDYTKEIISSASITIEQSDTKSFLKTEFIDIL